MAFIASKEREKTWHHEWKDYRTPEACRSRPQRAALTLTHHAKVGDPTT